MKVTRPVNSLMDLSMSLFQMECDVFAALCQDIRTPVALEAEKALQENNWLHLTSINVSPSHYVSASSYAFDAQIAAFFKKFPGFNLGIDLKAAAVSTFYESERQCFLSNERLNPLLSDFGFYGERLGVFVSTWRKKIRSVLGRAPTPAALSGRFGPGSTFLNVGDDITVAHKLTDAYSATLRFGPFSQSWDESAWGRYARSGLGDFGVNRDIGPPEPLKHPDVHHAVREVEIVRGNRFTTVPKDSRRLRGICVEPSLNVFYQLAIGQFMSQRMEKRLGWDKSTCASEHRNLAQIGSLTKAVATIDLSNASDTVCKNLVKLLLPPDWYRLVDDLRSTHTLIEKRWVRVEKFSSMGNGYTFELETLLFRTLCDTVAELEAPTEDPFTPGLAVSVFGDDIVVPSSIAKSLIAALKFFGFTPNEQKTFLEGEFRESCGGDFFAGQNVRPFYLKESCDEPHQLISLANGIRRSSRLHDRSAGIHAYRTAWFRCLDYIPREIRQCRGPEQLGDLVIHDEEPRWRHLPTTITRNSIRYVRVWRPVPNRMIPWVYFRPGVVIAAALYGVPDGTPSTKPGSDPLEQFRRSGVVPRLRGSYVSGYRFGRVAFS